jgi:hypothetical protein
VRDSRSDRPERAAWDDHLIKSTSNRGEAYQISHVRLRRLRVAGVGSGGERGGTGDDWTIEVVVCP